ncbi:MAG: plastocyanin/azurin family copper-binding protein [archaeon]
MNKIFALVILFILALLLSGCVQQPSSQENSQNSAVADQKQGTVVAQSGEVIVTIKEFVFEPKEIVIKKGSTVKWVNEDASPHLIASNPHPVHTDLPELVSNELNKGEEHSFTFTKTGTFGYHCHIHPAMKGSVTVVD